MKQTTKLSLTLKQHWRITSAILQKLNRLGELSHLIEWIERTPTNRRGKWAKRVYNIYIEQSETLQGKLPILKHNYAVHYWVAYGLYYASNLLSVNPYRKKL